MKFGRRVATLLLLPWAPSVSGALEPSFSLIWVLGRPGVALRFRPLLSFPLGAWSFARNLPPLRLVLPVDPGACATVPSWAMMREQMCDDSRVPAPVFASDAARDRARSTKGPPARGERLENRRKGELQSQGSSGREAIDVAFSCAARPPHWDEPWPRQRNDTVQRQSRREARGLDCRMCTRFSSLDSV
jgi:hypothetical protein